MPLFPARNLNFFNVRDYGAKGDGSTDDTSAIAAARSAAIAAGGGTVYYPAGTYISQNQTLSSNVNDVGAGAGVTAIKLKNGANTDLFSAQTGSISLSATFNAGIVGTLSNFSIQGITLDGNKANQSSGTSYPLRFYGYGFLLRDVEILNGYSGGILMDWNGNLGASMEADCENVRVHDCNGIGWQMGGPHDSRFINVLVYTCGSHCIHIAPNAQGMLFTQGHPYNPPNVANTVNWLIEADGCQFIDCLGDGSYGVNIAMIAGHCSWQGGLIIGQTGNQTTAIGMQLGQLAGNTPFPGQIRQAAGVTTSYAADNCIINTMIWYQLAGSLSMQNETNNTIIATCKQVSGSAIIGPNSPLINSTDNYMIHIEGLTADGSVAKGGGMQVSGSANPLFLVKDTTNNTIPFAVDGFHDTVGIVASPNSGIACLLTSGSDSKKGLVIYANSGTQSADLFEVQDSGFNNLFAVGAAGNMGLFTAINTSFGLLMKTPADNKQGLSIYPNSGSQSVPVFSTQNSSFATVFSVDKNGATLINGGSTMYSGSGAPSNGNGSNGDYYFRTDTPGTVLQRIYVKASGVWAGVV